MSRSEWVQATLADCVDTINSGVSVNSDDRPRGPGEIGVLKTSAVGAGSFDPDENKVVAKRDRSRVAEPVLGGSVLFSRMNTPRLVGESCYVEAGDPSLFLPDRLWQIRVDSSRADARWFSYALLESRAASEIKRLATGTSGSMKNIAKSGFLGICILTPPIEEQRRIAEILAALDGQIRASESVTEKLVTIHTATLDDLLDDLPKESYVRLKHHLLVPPKNGYSPVAAHESTGEYMLGLGCLTVRGFVPRQLKHAPVGDVRLQPFQLGDGDVLISRSNTRDLVGLAGVFRDVGAPCYYPDLMMRLVPSGTVSNTYLAAVLNTQRVRRQITNVASGTSGSMVKITKSTVETLTLPIPSRSEQDRIEAATRAATEALDSELNRLEKLRFLKAGLIDDLLTGRVRLADEAAS
ncbi:restriction endonuclease subunit S [Kribbella sp. CA-245084]|uniref:restriction endonuclease subunit S n=1 Tax=Kribbella sp. CA-245084 TaxID=3239940 RepID=UPI003D94FE6E